MKTTKTESQSIKVEIYIVPKKNLKPLKLHSLTLLIILKTQSKIKIVDDLRLHLNGAVEDTLELIQVSMAIKPDKNRRLI